MVIQWRIQKQLSRFVRNNKSHIFLTRLWVMWTSWTLMPWTVALMIRSFSKIQDLDPSEKLKHNKVGIWIEGIRIKPKIDLTLEVPHSLIAKLERVETVLGLTWSISHLKWNKVNYQLSKVTLKHFPNLVYQSIKAETSKSISQLSLVTLQRTITPKALQWLN